ncbi:WcbI family polysaccharide biosynthesis putative acetyltransferase [Sphingobium sp.]|uniref:WcbI family polysaccharide biosynthesis putative acetyltransferase n=1 Tax=Sphingobium sp. TaxID=1912891 RepID=UPI003BB6468C
MPTIAIMGNCQAQELEAMTLMYSNCQVITLPPVFMMTEGDEDKILSKVANADIIFSQRVGDDYPIRYARTNYLKDVFPSVISWPNIYHSGYFPDARYVYLDGIGKLVGPLDDYHLEIVRAAYVEGLSVIDCLAQYELDNFLAMYPDPVGASIAELHARENDVDLKISDFIQSNVFDKKLFYTSNHPVRTVLLEMISRMLKAVGVVIEKPDFHPYALSKINLPVYEAVRQLYGIKELPLGSFVGIDRLHINTPIESTAARVFEDLQDVVESFYRFYDSVPAIKG